MKKSLAKALLEAGIEHFDTGGSVNTLPQQNVIQPPPLENSSNPLNSNASAGFNSTNLTGGNLAMNSAAASLAPIGQGLQNIAGSFTAQNGYQAQLAPTTQSDYTGLINNAANNSLSGYNQYQNTLNGQNTLAQEMQRQAGVLQNQQNGQGPSPAQMQLNQATGQNVANQAALMASQRGASANPGAIGRNAAEQGAAIQQNAVGQGATLGAQQQIAAQQLLAQNQAAQANLYGQQGNLITGEQSAANNLFGSAAGAQNTQNSNLIQNYNMMQGLNQNTASQNAAATNSTLGGLLGGGGSAMSMLSRGGKVAAPHHYFADGGMSEGDSAPVSFMAPPAPPPSSGGGSGGGGGGGGGIMALAALLKSGGDVPGRASVKGDSYSNDTVPAMLSPGEAVIPRSVMNSGDAPEKAKEFIEQLQQKNKKSFGDALMSKKGTKPGYGKVLEAKNLKDRVANLEKLCYGGKP